MEAVKISKKAKQLKVDRGHHDDDFNKIIKNLKEEGILDKLEYTGEVIFFKPDKGFGFIKVADGEEYFFHRTEIDNRATPKIGDRFRFKLGSRKRAIKAHKIN